MKLASARVRASSFVSWLRHGDTRTHQKGAAKRDDLQENYSVPPGIANLGNTCYMNAVIQCLLNAPGLPLKNVAFDHDNVKDMTQLAKAFALLIQEYSSTNMSLAKNNQALQDMKAAIGDVGAQYIGCEQHDAYEFLGHLLERLDEDFLKNATVAHRSEDLCGVKTYNTRECHDCSSVFKVDEVTDLVLRLPLAMQQTGDTETVTSVEALLEDIWAPEHIEGYECITCNSDSGSRRLSSITQRASLIAETSDVLILVLCRFCHAPCGDGFVTKKTHRKVDCPTELTLNTGQYSLFGVVSHIGERLTSGHYIANVKSIRDNAWYECDDSRVKPMGLNGAQCKVRAEADPYILFYRRRSGAAKEEFKLPGENTTPSSESSASDSEDDKHVTHI